MKQIFFLAALIFSACGRNETEKRNTYMNELIAKRNEYQRQYDSAKGALVAIQGKISEANRNGAGITNIDSITGPAMDALYMAETNLEMIKKDIDSLSLLK